MDEILASRKWVHGEVDTEPNATAMMLHRVHLVKARFWLKPARD
jgi:hypothetical protein